jgi:hypothetical protein
MYVIKKRFYKDRLISILLQLPGRQDTLIIGAYIPPFNGSNNKLISECHSTLISWIIAARSANTHVLLGGDINADYDSYIKNISDPIISSPNNSLFYYLHSHLFDDLCAFDPSSSPAPTFKSSSSGHLSRLDYIWISPAFPATFLWSHVFDPSDTFSTDHFLLVAFFDFINIKDLHAPSYLKQRVRCRIEYDFHSALPEQKDNFTSEVDRGLKKQVSYHGNRNLNRLWHQFKSSLLSAARLAFPKRTISLNKPRSFPLELRPFGHLSHRLDRYIGSLSKLLEISGLYNSWNRFFPSFSNEFNELYPDHTELLDVLPLPSTLYTVFVSSNLGFFKFLVQFRSLLRPLKRFISGKITLEMNKYKNAAMKAAISERNFNFYEDKGKFIRSSLNREKRSIVLDRVLVTDIPGNPQLLIAPDDIHKAAIKHFQNVVGPNRSPYKVLSQLPDRW